VLTESQVIGAVCRHLERQGWTIASTCNETQRGFDIVAMRARPKAELIVEAKGETSSMTHTRRHGKPFDSRQVRSHVSRALFSAASHHGKSVRAAIALPGNLLHRRCVEAIRPALQRLAIEVFWVDGNRKVTPEGIWGTGKRMKHV
jgi:hypothetical protein